MLILSCHGSVESRWRILRTFGECRFRRMIGMKRPNSPSFVKTSCVREINDLATKEVWILAVRFSSRSHRSDTSSDGWSLLLVPERPLSSKTCSPSATVSSVRQTTSPPAHRVAQAVLGGVAKALGRMENSAHSGHPSNSGGLASGWLPVVLEVALKS